MNTSKQNKNSPTKVPQYIEELLSFQKEYADFSEIKFLINNAVMANEFLKVGQLPQSIPKMQLPHDMQNRIFKKLNNSFEKNDPQKDLEWDRLSNDLPKLENQLRNFRDYLEDQYGMWAYISSSFTYQLSKYIGDKKILEVMAGNGYISKGLRDNGTNVISTDSLSWKSENETGKHLVTDVEKLSAMEAFNKYKDQIDFIIMSWSPDGVPIDNELLKAIRGSKRNIKLIVIGEKNGATNSKEFWQNAKLINSDEINKLNRYYPNFDLINDHVYLVK